MATVKELLNAREAELMETISGMYQAIQPYEAELADVRKAKAALGMGISNEPPKRASGISEFGSQSEPDANPYRKLSMKQLTVRALQMHFPDTGATARMLLELFHNQWGRTDIVRESLSPQLSRLRAEGVIDRSGTTWFLSGGRSPPDRAGDYTHYEGEGADTGPQEDGDGGPVPGQTLDPSPRGSTPPVSTFSTGEEVATSSPNEGNKEDLFAADAPVVTGPTRQGEPPRE